MPFTLAHPAAVLPLLRRPWVGLALVAGAMAPDAAYFLRATPLEVTAQSWYEPFANATTSHSLGGLVVTLAWALVIFLVLWSAVRPVIWVVSGRWEPSPGARRGLEAGGWVVVSLVVGVVSHLLWDSFASSDGVLASRVEALREPVVADLSWVRLIQHLSTVVGLVVLAVALWRRREVLADQPPAGRRRAYRTVAGLVAFGVVAGLAFVLATVDLSTVTGGRDKVETVLARAAMGGGAAVGLLVAAAVAAWWAALPWGRRRTVLDATPSGA